MEERHQTPLITTCSHILNDVKGGWTSSGLKGDWKARDQSCYHEYNRDKGHNTKECPYVW